jgi:hypothetical protein
MEAGKTQHFPPTKKKSRKFIRLSPLDPLMTWTVKAALDLDLALFVNCYIHP